MNNIENLLVLSYEWPNEYSGSGIAINTSLRAYLEVFDSVHFLCCTDVPISEKMKEDFPTVNFQHIPIQVPTIAVRFFLNLFSRWPAMAYQFGRKSVIKKVDALVFEYSHNRATAVIFEHIPVSILMHKCKSINSIEKVCVRSFDVLYKAFTGVSGDGNIIWRKIWDIEQNKIEFLERRSLVKADLKWAISLTDKEDYEEEGIHIDGVIGVSIDIDRLKMASIAQKKVATYLGSYDLRKKSGINSLVNEVWPMVIKVVPDAELHLGGRGSKNYENKKINVISHGFVESETKFLSIGAISINPQLVGSGIKLKSLNAMAARRVLIAFKNGLRGVGGEKNKHYYECETNEEMAKCIVNCMDDDFCSDSVLDSASNFVAHAYSYQSISANMVREISKVKRTEE